MPEIIEAINSLTNTVGSLSTGGIVFVLWLFLLFKQMGGQNDNQKKLTLKHLQLIEKKLGCSTEKDIGVINKQIATGLADLK